MLEFSRRELEFKLDGEVHRLKYPSVKQMAQYSKTYDESKDQFETIIEFLEKLGLKRGVSEEMEINHLTTIVKALTEEKK